MLPHSGAARHVLRYSMAATHPTFKLKSSTPDWPVDLPALFRSIPSRDPHFRMFILARALQHQDLDAVAVVSDLTYSKFDSRSPIESAHGQTWPWSLDSRRSHPEPAVRLGDKLWTINGARRWEDALLSRHSALADSLLPNQLAEMTWGEESFVEAPAYKPWTRQQELDALQAMAPVVVRDPKGLTLAEVMAPPPFSLDQANRALEDVLNARTDTFPAPIVPPDVLHNEGWLVMGTSSERAGILAFFEWGDPAKQAALEQQWMNHRFSPTPSEPASTPKGRRARL